MQLCHDWFNQEDFENSNESGEKNQHTFQLWQIIVNMIS